MTGLRLSAGLSSRILVRGLRADLGAFKSAGVFSLRIAQ